MPIEIKLGEPHLTIHHGHGVLVSNRDGNLDQPSQKGLFFRDTRLLSTWKLSVEGQVWQLLNSANESFRNARVVLVSPPLKTSAAELKEHVLELSINRLIGEGMHEDLDLHNYAQSTVDLILQLAIASDFADFFEVKSEKICQRSGISSHWSEHDQALTNIYRRKSFCRGLVVRIRNSDSQAVFANGSIVFPIHLTAGARWHTCMAYEFIDGAERFGAPDCPRQQKATAPELQPKDAQDGLAVISAGSPNLDGLIRQSLDDLVALQLYVPGAHGDPIPAGGVPWFLSLFGRDSIIASLQFQVVDPDLSRGALDRLAGLQANSFDDYRDAEPGKIPHELRHGELAFFHEIPHTPYYGTADATPLYLILLHSTWRCTGDDTLLKRHLGTAERCLHWIDAYGDLDGDGFQEYQTRSPAGYENQSWKDAGDAISYPDGTLVKGPKATCELQGYVFDAWLRMADVFSHLGDAARAAALRHKAADLKDRFNEAFWDEHSGFYALALDGHKRAVTSVASNVGHCLWSGIVPRERAARVVHRLMQPDMWSGWGIRTLSSLHPRFNPHSYQNGSVWPHDNSIIALGMKRYGFDREVSQVTLAICEAASYFMANRLPELYAGTARDEISFPLRYLGSNVPQAWATGAVFALVQALIGFEPDAPRGRLRLDPALPDWLPELNIWGLRIGGERIDLRFTRDGESTSFDPEHQKALSIERTTACPECCFTRSGSPTG